MLQYHDDLPLSCPPCDAEELDADLYKAIDGRQPTLRDFQSFAERGRDGTDKSACESWGLSVWPHMKAVEHALKAYKFFRKKRIIKFTITSNDGCLKSTPSKPQPEHHTFWKSHGSNLLNTCEIVIDPSNQ
ncbi:hypothetical protein [Rhizobium sp. 21-4511-3d]